MSKVLRKSERKTIKEICEERIELRMVIIVLLRARHKRQVIATVREDSLQKQTSQKGSR